MEPRDARLGNYEVLLPLAAGGMAEVSIARRIPSTGATAVVKRVHRHLVRDRGFCNLFRDEARIATLIRHPNVVSVDDVIDERGELVLVLPYVEGVSLAQLLAGDGEGGERGALAAPIAARILVDVLAGLEAAHHAVDPRGAALHVVHRDVRPENVLVGVDGTSRLLDFGIAKARERMPKSTASATKGKLAYLAPEQLQQRPVDRRADLFAAGAVLHEALSGREPPEGSLRSGEIAPLAEPLGLPAAVDGLLARALAPEPAERFESAAALSAALVAAVPPARPSDVAAVVGRRCHALLETRRRTLATRLSAPPPGKTKPNPFLTGEARAPVFGGGPLPTSPGDLVLDDPDTGDPEDKAVVFQRENLQIAANDTAVSSRPPPPDATPSPVELLVPAASPDLLPASPAPPTAPKDGAFYAANGVVSVLALAFLGWLLVLRSGGADIGVDVSFLPAVNATLNGVSATLLVVGYRAIRAKNPGLHKRAMMSAFVASALFLVTYVVYHYVHGDTKYAGTGALRGVYFFVLITHVLLSMAVVPLCLTAFYFAFKKRFAAHKKVTRYALPIWLYVSVTGVLIFALLKASGSAP